MALPDRRLSSSANPGTFGRINRLLAIEVVSSVELKR
jgi:hypothetical protein